MKDKRNVEAQSCTELQQFFKEINVSRKAALIKN